MDFAPRRRHLIERLESRLLFTASELIVNGSFEGTATDISNSWTLTGQLQADARFSNVHSGLGYAYLADASGNAANSITGTMSQTVTIPASSTALSLSFWTKITTPETSGANDTLSVQVLDSTGTSVLANVATLSNLNSSSSYVRWAYTLPNSLFGQTVQVRFTATNNATNATTFRIDDVGLSYAPTPSTMKVVGYLPGTTGMSQIDWSQLTWVNYFSRAPHDDGTMDMTAVPSSVVTTAHANGLGVSISMVMPSPYTALPAIAADPVKRATFANSALTFIQNNNIDGIDIDWEPKATGVNQANYALLIDALYAKLHPFGYNITSASNPWTYEIPVAATNEMDWVNVMCYDFDYANHSTYADSIGGMNGWSNTYGVEKRKLVMGVPFYGRWGTSWSDTHSKGYGDLVYSGATNHILSDYKTINGAYPALNIDSYTDAAGHTTYFNGVTTMEQKMAFVRDNGFGGAMIWELAYDHVDASLKNDRWTLLSVIGTMMKTPSWLTPATGSTYDLANGTFYLDSGSVTFSSDSVAAKPTLNLATGTTATFNTSQRISGIITTGTGKVDIKNNKVVVDYTGSSTPLGAWNGSTYTGLTGLIVAGRNGGNWNGPGIVTSMTAAKLPSRVTTVGIAEASAALGISGSQTKVWNGYTVDATTVLTRYTFAGDANLDGVINGDDYFLIDSNNGLSGSSVGYAKGDFDYNGKVNADDYFIIDSNYNKMAMPLGISSRAALPAAEASTTNQPKSNFLSPQASAYDRLIDDSAMNVM